MKSLLLLHSFYINESDCNILLVRSKSTVSLNWSVRYLHLEVNVDAEFVEISRIGRPNVFLVGMGYVLSKGFWCEM